MEFTDRSPASTPIAIVGAGFAGLAMAIALVRAGRRDFVIFEKDDDVGGTWKVNTYPGCACDVPSHLYSLSAAPNPDWSRAFSPQAEIWAYQCGLVEQFDLRPHLRLKTRITRASFDERAGRWRLETDGEETVTAQILVSGMGGLSTPSIPELPGAERFEGARFHSAAWDHEYPLENKRVAVVGTGASAIQFVPQIAPRAAQIHLFQRTPPWVLPKPDRAISPDERARFRALPLLQRLVRAAIYWGLEWRATALVRAPWITRLVKRIGVRHIREHVSDPKLQAALTPDYLPGCKRILLSNDYYPALARDDVEVVTSGIREIRERSIVSADGVEREVDAIIYGTGFKATDPVPRGVVFGRGGLDLVDAWADGPEAYKGTTVAGFPNLFFITGPNTGLGHTSVLVMMEAQIRYILGALGVLSKKKAEWLDVRPEAQARYNAKLQKRLEGTVWNTGGCASWYQHANGKNVTLWPGYTVSFRLMLARFDPEAYELHAAPAQPRATSHAASLG